MTGTGAKVGDTVTLTLRGKPVGVRIGGEVFDTGNDGRTVFTALATLKPAAPDLNSTTQYVDLKPGTDADAYVTALDAELKPLVLGGVVLDTHERVHDLGVHKALGMTPRQTVTTVVTSVVLPGLAGGPLGVPLGLAVHSAATALRAE